MFALSFFGLTGCGSPTSNTSSIESSATVQNEIQTVDEAEIEDDVSTSVAAMLLAFNVTV